MALAEAMSEAIWPLLVGQLSLSVLAAWLASGTSARRGVAVAVVLAASVLPIGLRELPFLSFLAGLFGVLFSIRIIDLARGSKLGTLERVLFIVVYFDIRGRRRVPPSVDLRRITVGLVWAAVTTGAFFSAYLGADALGEPWRSPVRWGSGALATYGTFEAADHLLGAVALALGWEVPRVQLEPVRSTSLGEFWGHRWNRVVHSWLRRHCFLPLARRRHPRLGIAWSFAVSSAIHFWAVFVPGGMRHVAPMTLFFVIQGALTLAEYPLRQRRWPTAARRGWTVGWLLVTAPLFVEPLLSVFAGT